MQKQSHAELKQFILPLFTELPIGEFQCIGSCVVIVTAKAFAIALTARHVVDHSNALHDEHALSDLRVAEPFRIKPFDAEFTPQTKAAPPMKGRVFAFLPSHGSMAVLRSVSYYPGKSLDIAAVTLELIDGPIEHFPMQCAIASNGPAVGQPLMLVGYPKGNQAEISSDLTKISVRTKRATSTGRCIRRFDWDEDYFVRSPGFVVSAGSMPGFSGGAVLGNTEKGLTLLGIISSSDDSETKAAVIWPALGLDNGIPHNASVPDTLLGLATSGLALPDLHEASKHVRIDATKPHTHLRDFIRWVEDPESKHLAWIEAHD